LSIEKEGGDEEEGNWSRTVKIPFPIMSESASTIEF
jgi:hypothetical protein